MGWNVAEEVVMALFVSAVVFIVSRALGIEKGDYVPPPEVGDALHMAMRAAALAASKPSKSANTDTQAVLAESLAMCTFCALTGDATLATPAILRMALAMSDAAATFDSDPERMVEGGTVFKKATLDKLRTKVARQNWADFDSVLKTDLKGTVDGIKEEDLDTVKTNIEERISTAEAKSDAKGEQTSPVKNPVGEDHYSPIPSHVVALARPEDDIQKWVRHSRSTAQVKNKHKIHLVAAEADVSLCARRWDLDENEWLDVDSNNPRPPQRRHAQGAPKKIKKGGVNKTFYVHQFMLPEAMVEGTQMTFLTGSATDYILTNHWPDVATLQHDLNTIHLYEGAAAHFLDDQGTY